MDSNPLHPPQPNPTPADKPKAPKPKDRNKRARQAALAKQRDAKSNKVAASIHDQISQLSGRRDDLRDQMADKFLSDGHVGGLPVATRDQALAAAEIILTNADELPPVDEAPSGVS